MPSSRYSTASTLPYSRTRDTSDPAEYGLHMHVRGRQHGFDSGAQFVHALARICGNNVRVGHQGLDAFTNRFTHKI